MSHTVQVKTCCKNAEALRAACKVLKLDEPVYGSHKLFSDTVEGYAVNVDKSWKYPVVFNTETGEVKFDNYNGSWGKDEFLDRLNQRAAAEEMRLVAQKSGHIFNEQFLEDGTLELTIEETAPELVLATNDGEGAHGGGLQGASGGFSVE